MVTFRHTMVTFTLHTEFEQHNQWYYFGHIYTRVHPLLTAACLWPSVPRQDLFKTEDIVSNDSISNKT